MLSFGLITTACSSNSDEAEKEYTVPSAWCGYRVPAKTMEPLLPGGKKITTKTDDAQGLLRCDVLVDGEKVLYLGAERRAASTALSAGNAMLGPVSKLTASDDHYAGSDKAAVQLVPCPVERKDGQEVFAIVNAWEGSGDEADVKKAVTTYARAAADSTICTEFDS
ncbi:hypothetical protein ACIQU5_10105 [Streptomyces sp. NPDC090306]|uniref:hypothetical protein n=1 Tax=Streptomyces sp. NPDC090306 TaxID=3365961 RepID=UPI0038083C65